MNLQLHIVFIIFLQTTAKARRKEAQQSLAEPRSRRTSRLNSLLTSVGTKITGVGHKYVV